MTVKERYLIDETIRQLNEEDKTNFNRQYEYSKKKPTTLFMLTIFLFTLGAPFFYLGFRNSKPKEYLSVLIFWVGLYPYILFIAIAITISWILVLFLLLVLILFLIWLVYLEIVAAQEVETRVEEYNYQKKANILNNIK